MCYYTNEKDAFDQDGLPNGQYQPNFAARVLQTLDGDGLYRVQLKTYKGNLIIYEFIRISSI